MGLVVVVLVHVLVLMVNVVFIVDSIEITVEMTDYVGLLVTNTIIGLILVFHTFIFQKVNVVRFLVFIVLVVICEALVEDVN